MDMEWGIDERDGKVWILQARPETVFSQKKEKEEGEGNKTEEADANSTDSDESAVVTEQHEEVPAE